MRRYGSMELRGGPRTARQRLVAAQQPRLLVVNDDDHEATRIAAIYSASKIPLQHRISLIFAVVAMTPGTLAPLTVAPPSPASWASALIAIAALAAITVLLIADQPVVALVVQHTDYELVAERTVEGAYASRTDASRESAGDHSRRRRRR